MFKQLWAMLSELLEKLFGRQTVSSGLTAKQRLKLVIAHDRSGLSAERIEAMRKEILEVVARYVDIDTDSSEFSLENDEGMTALVANLPIRRIVPTRQPETISGEPQPAPEPPTPETPLHEIESTPEIERSPEPPDPEPETETPATETAIVERVNHASEKENEELEKPEETAKSEEI
jgi:cell division topological specificity factor